LERLNEGASEVQEPQGVRIQPSPPNPLINKAFLAVLISSLQNGPQHPANYERRYSHGNQHGFMNSHRQAAALAL
jgi:hypothetical protein